MTKESRDLTDPESMFAIVCTTFLSEWPNFEKCIRIGSVPMNERAKEFFEEIPGEIKKALEFLVEETAEKAWKENVTNAEQKPKCCVQSSGNNNAG